MKSLRLSLSFLLAGPLSWATDPAPLLRAHAHNDYEHPRPLFDALDHGFASIEADVFLVDGRLLVAHDRQDVKPTRTLEALYLEPLRARVRKNGGRVYRGGPTITLLVDVKSEAVVTYVALHATLQNYAEMLTIFRAGVATLSAITVIISGNRAPAVMGAQAVRYAALDGRIDDLAGQASRDFVPWISESWSKVFTWRWTGPLPEVDRLKLRQLVEQTHAQGRKLRFWNTPDNPEAWKFLYQADVDLLNSDNLAGLQAFLLAQPTAAGR